METIGGHHWMARRVPDDVVVVNPNQFGMDAFDLDDALGEGKAHLCSKDLRAFIAENDLDLNQNGAFNPRDVFGSHTDMDHIYNTPRAWFMGRYLTPYSHRWEGENAEFTPESDNIPWSFIPDRKIAVEDVKYMLSGHYQGTEFDPYLGRDTGKRGRYRSIFGSTAFAAMLPVYPNVPKLPKYLSNVTLDVSTENYYWASRLIGTLADHDYPGCVQHIERYENAVMTKGRQIVREYDRRMTETGDFSLAAEANEKLCKMAREQTTGTLGKVLYESSVHMKNGYNRADN